MSTLRVNAIQNTSGVEQYLAKAWVNFNGTGTVAIRAAGNVSSITDNGVGDYTVNFTNSFADSSYSAVASGANATLSSSTGYNTLVAAASNGNAGNCRVMVVGTGTSPVLQDSLYVSVAIFR